MSAIMILPTMVAVALWTVRERGSRRPLIVILADGIERALMSVARFIGSLGEVLALVPNQVMLRYRARGEK